jgi:hypothetical protein
VQVTTMGSRLNLAAGIAIFLATLVGLGVFVVTMFSFNAGVIFTGLVFTGLAALALLVLIYKSTAPTPWSAYGDVGIAVLGLAHLVLAVSNLVVGVFALPLVYGAVLDRRFSDRLPMTEDLIVAAIALSTILSLGIVAATNRRRGRVA